MNPKTRKLLTKPHIFVRDMVGKRLQQVEQRLPRVRTLPSRHRYSVVIAVQGPVPFLDELLRTLRRQTLDFRSSIEVLVVDYGTTESPNIVTWRRSNPGNIRVLRHEVGTRATAWNVGLAHATGDWVTFIEPTDFVHERYFEHVENFLHRPYSQELALLFCRTIVYRQNSRTFSDSDPLRFRFSGGSSIRNTAELARHVQSSLHGVFFRLDRIRRNGRAFDGRLQVGFEDAHFVGRYLLEASGEDVGFIAKARHYRRQGVAPAATPTPWSDAERFGSQLEHCHLDLFLAAEAREGTIPKWLQRSVLYGLMPYVRHLVNHEERLAFLSAEQRQRLRELLEDLFARIDSATIRGFHLAGCTLIRRVGLLGFFKREEFEKYHIHVETYDAAQGLLQLRYFYAGNAPFESFHLGAREVGPRFGKVRRYELFGETFVLDRIAWLVIGEETTRLHVRIAGAEARIGVRSRVYRGGVLLDRVRDAMNPTPRVAPPWYVKAERAIATSAPVRTRYREALLFIDRDWMADDNAEHLYRHVARHRPELNAFFVLRRDSADWDRLNDDGFRLIEYGSLAHRHALVHARHVISSHAAPFVLSVLVKRYWRDLETFRFSFLQHGVIKDDLSNWLNNRPIDCFVTASPAEYHSIVATGSPYKYTEREVILSGLPRHDALGLDGPVETERKLLIMPTWRESLAGQLQAGSSARTVNPVFYESDYARRWKAVLHSASLRTLAEENGFAVVFVAHANVQPYLDWFDTPAFIEPGNNSKGVSIQKAFQTATLMLTDYSSTAFDMAYLMKPVVYYQFDRDIVFGGGHSTKKGYFDYETDGFGPVCRDEAGLFQALAELMGRGGKPHPIYLDRMERAFAYRDGQNCERVIEAILKLDQPVVDPHHYPASASGDPDFEDV